MQPILNVLLRKDKEKDGKCPIIIQIYHKGKRRQVFTGLTIEEKFFKDGKAIKIINATWYNQMIANKHNALEKEYLTQAIEKDGAIDLGGQDKRMRKDYFGWAYAHYNGLGNRATKDYIYRCISDIRQFEEWAGPQNFQSITGELLKKYEDYLFAKGNARNTVNRKFKRIKQVFVAAKAPYFFKPVSYKQTKRTSLTMDEVAAFEKVNINSVVKDYFLIGCLTGIRYSDMSKLKKCLVTNNGISHLLIETEKTKDIISIKVSDKVLQLINDLTAPIPTNQVCNKILKQIAILAGINKNITFHVSRHTFAVNCLTLGFPLKVVSQLLGHSTVRTTEIYAKYRDVNIDEFMNLWEK